MVAWDVFSAGWAVASAAGIVAVGLALARDARKGVRGAVPFSLFAVAWGLQVGVINVALHSARSIAPELFLFSAALVGLQPYLLVEFSAAYADGGPRRPVWTWVRRIAAVLAIATPVVILVEPSLVLNRVFDAGNQLYPVWGALELPLFGIPRTIAFGLAVFVLFNAVDQAPTRRTKNRLATIAIGLALYAAHMAGNNGVFFGYLAATPDPRSIAFTVSFGALAALCLFLAVKEIRAGLGAPVEEERKRSLFMGGALVLPLVAGALERGLVLAGVLPDRLFLVGLWRLAGVGVIAYGLARWRSYDLPTRVHRRAASATGAAGALAGGASAYGAGALVLGTTAVPALVGLLVGVLSLVPGMRWTQRLLGPDEPENPIEQDQQQFEKRIDAYRAALEASMARGTLDEDRTFLEGLRGQFEITDSEHRVVQYYARQSVVPTREGDPDGAYQRIRILGEGGAGRTWLARDRSRDRLVVLKEPLARWHEEPSILEAARREARLAAKVRHPNVVEVERVIEDDGIPVLVLEHVAGGSLAELLRSRGTLDWRTAVRLTHDVAQGLAAVHRAGIVHRDIKPSNVLITEEGKAKLTDFGIARRQGTGTTRVLEGTRPLGTEAYMAPEVRSGNVAGDERSDVYTCTAMLYTCLRGRSPSEGGPHVEGDLPAALSEVLAKGLAVEPDHRYQDAEALAEDLAAVIGG